MTKYGQKYILLGFKIFSVNCTRNPCVSTTPCLDSKIRFRETKVSDSKLIVTYEEKDHDLESLKAF